MLDHTSSLPVLQVALGDLVKVGLWMFVYRPCVAPNLEEPSIFGTSPTAAASEGVGSSMAYRVVHRPAEHISSAIAGVDHLLYGSVTTLCRLIGWEPTVEIGREMNWQLPSGERIPVGSGAWTPLFEMGSDVSGLSGRRDMGGAHSLSPVSVDSLRPGMRHVSLLGRVLHVATRVEDDGKTATVCVKMYFLPCSSLHGNGAAVHSICLITCTSSYERTGRSDSMSHLISTLPLTASVKAGHQLFLAPLTVVSTRECIDGMNDHDDMSLDYEVLRGLSAGHGTEAVAAECSHHLSLPPSALSQFVRPTAGASDQQASLWDQLIAAGDSNRPDSADSLLYSGGCALNLSRLVGLSTSSGILNPATMSSLLAAGRVHPSCLGCLVLPGTIVGEWSDDRVEAVSERAGEDASRRDNDHKRRRITSESLGEATQVRA